MKNCSWFSFIAWFVLVTLVFSCQEEAQSPVQPGNVRFTIHARPDGSAGGRVSGALPAGASLYLTIADAWGHPVHTLTQVDLLELNGEYISAPLLLPPGEYTLQEFLVTDADDEVVYAAPKEDSPLAPWVTDPLPASFSVTGDAITGRDVQVLAVGEHSAEEFGYVTFRVDVSPSPYFRLSVFVHDSANALVFSPVRACILEGTDTVYKQTLPAGVQSIAFVGDPSRTYTLSLTQPSYRRYTQAFVLSELLETLGGAPLSVTLTPALTFTSVYHYSDYAYDLRLNDGVNDLLVDWGDGVIEPVVLSIFGSLEHVYHDGQLLHFVSIYGDLESITAVESYYGYGATTEISLANLPNLQTFAAAETQSPAYMDFRHNPLIEMISLAYSDVRSFDLPEGARLRSVDVVANTGMSAASLNAAIRAAYLGQIERGYDTGYLYLSVFPGGVGGFVAPVTEESLTMVRALRDSYGWTVWPYNF